MNKRTLKKWLERQRDAAIRAVRDQAEKDQQSYTEERDTQFDLRATAEEIHELLSKAETIWEKRKEEINATHPGIRWQPGLWGTIHNQLREIDTTEKLVERMQRELVDETERYEELRTAKNTLINGIHSNYDKVITNISGMKNAKEAVTYLTGLGFDLSELLAEDAQETALMVQIDTKFLFVGNKEERT